MQSPDSGKVIRTLVLFPGALGDFLCWLPALQRLRARYGGTIAVVAKEPWLDLLGMPDTVAVSIDRREIADLYRSGGEIAPETHRLLGGFRRAYSWTGHGHPGFAPRLAQLGEPGAEVSVFPFRNMVSGEHASTYFVRCLDGGAAGNSADAGDPLAAVPPQLRRDDEWHNAFLAAHNLRRHPRLVVHAGSGSPRKTWPGFGTAIEAWRESVSPVWRVIEVRGPAEDAIPPIPDAVCVTGQPLSRIASLLAHADAYLGNDSGITHLAGIVGVPVLALFGPSDPSVWRPLGERSHVLHRPVPCDMCGDRLCLHRCDPQDVAERLRRITAT